jgi:putative DNA methylase
LERRFIEEDFPVKEISKISTDEKSSNKKGLSTFHIWWARRPLSASRATIFSSLIDIPEKPKEKTSLENFIIKLSKLENSSNLTILNEAKKMISEKNYAPKVLDPFGGGGNIPLEAYRLGCETYSSDYNPVSVLIQKCVLEYPARFGNEMNSNGLIKNNSNLLSDIEKIAIKVNDKTKKELEFLFITDPKEIILGYIWVKFVTCKNPKCGLQIPILPNYWLCDKTNKKVAIYPKKENSKINFEIVGDGYSKIPSEFTPKNGNMIQAHLKCLFCNSIIDPSEIKKIFHSKKYEEKIIAVVYLEKNKKGKKYRLPLKTDLDLMKKADNLLKEKEIKLKKEWGLEPIPDEIIPTPDLKEYELGGVTWKSVLPVLYGMTKWKDLFNRRQTLVLVTFIEKLRITYHEMLKDGFDDEYADAIISYLALSIDNLAEKNNRLNRWVTNVEAVAGVFAMQILQMRWIYAEANPFEGSIEWLRLVNYKMGGLFNWNHNYKAKKIPNVRFTSATDLDFDDEYFDAVITDPPYYDMIPYAILSDFFYVWLKRSLNYIHPELFSTPLSPKTEEATSELSSIRGINKKDVHTISPTIKTKEDFEVTLSKSFKEMSRVLKKNGIVIVVYAHKSTDGWETLINSLLDSGLVVTAAWPINTERKSRFRANDSATLASSIYMICRKWEKEEIGFYRDVKKELKQYLSKKLEQLWNEGIAGADFFIASIGSAIEVFGKYEKVIDDNDEQISVLKLLNDTRDIVTDYAINKVIKGEFSDAISTMTRFYILWRWAYGEAKVPFDDASKMAQSVGINLENEWNKGFIIKDKDMIRVIGPQDRNEDELEDTPDLIDILHKTLQIWKQGKMNEVDKFLEEKGYKNSEVFKRVAQAISESLPLESTEKKWSDGFLTGFKSDDSQSGTQSKLFLDGEE